MGSGLLWRVEGFFEDVLSTRNRIGNDALRALCPCSRSQEFGRQVSNQVAVGIPRGWETTQSTKQYA